VTSETRLVIHAGRAEARLALAAPDGLGRVSRCPLAAPDAIAAVLADFLAGPGRGVRIARAAVAAAARIEGGEAALDAAPGVIRAQEVAAALGGAPVALLSEAEAVAHGLAALGPGEAETLVEGVPAASAPRLALVVGEELHGSLALPLAGGRWRAVATEPGATRFAAVSEAEQALLGMIETVGDIASGRGIAAVHARLAGLRDGPKAEEVLAAAGAGEAIPSAVRDLMLGVLGRVAGDLVLATGAWGGVWLSGGVASAWEAGWTDALLPHSVYKGPMTERMRHVPIRRIRHPEPALLGLAALAEDDPAWQRGPAC
jgi:glucokinase